MRHDNAAQRTGQITRGKNAKGLHLSQPFWNVGREKQLPDYRSEKDKDNEIVEFERATQRCQRQRGVILTIKTGVGLLSHHDA